MEKEQEYTAGILKEKLKNVQQELKAPKDLINRFGGFNYRSAESILENVKPLLNKYGLILTISDEIVNIGARYYVKATARIESVNDSDIIISTAYAREPETKKGMDDSQITGATSSYARKYALNGLFAIDDNKDADSYEPPKENEKPNSQPTPPTSKVDDELKNSLLTKLSARGVDLSAMCKYYKRNFVQQLTLEELEDALKRIGG